MLGVTGTTGPETFWISVKVCLIDSFIYFLIDSFHLTIYISYIRAPAELVDIHACLKYGVVKTGQPQTVKYKLIRVHWA